jgi:hypothetical protein
MSNFLSDIRAALETALLTVTPSWPVAFENVIFSPPSNGKYLKSKLLQSQPKNYAGTDGKTMYQGMFSVLVVVPTGDLVSSGPGSAEEQAALVMAKFARGAAFTAGLAVVRIGQAPWAAPATQTDLEYNVPVWVPWFCHI